MDLIRLLLLHHEGHEKVDLSNYSEAQQAYHTAQLIDAELLKGHVIRRGGNAVGNMVSDLTWTGHDFLGAARSNTVWAKAMAKVKSAGVDVSISVMKDLLIQLSKDALGM
jgi:hypothetical protein